MVEWIVFTTNPVCSNKARRCESVVTLTPSALRLSSLNPTGPFINWLTIKSTHFSCSSKAPRTKLADPQEACCSVFSFLSSITVLYPSFHNNTNFHLLHGTIHYI